MSQPATAAVKAAPSERRGMLVRTLGRSDYPATFAAMRAFTAARGPDTPDELWLVEHAPVFTLGQGGRPEHVHAPGAIPVLRTDRGGQVTHHGPGQVLAYPLVDLHRRAIRVREFVAALEDAVIDLLAELGLEGLRVDRAPGVYVRIPGEAGAGEPGRDRSDCGTAVAPRSPPPDFTGLAKVAALGIKVSAGRSYHGLALNVDMDLAPFEAIDPCGYPGLRTLDLRSLGVRISMDEAGSRIAQHCVARIDAASRP